MDRTSPDTWTACCTLNQNQLQADWQTYCRTRDPAVRDRLIEHYLPHVKHYCEWYHGRLPVTVQVDEVISAGIDGLRSAVEAFNPDLGIRFETYCNSRMHGAVRDYLRHIDCLPRQMRSDANHVARSRQELTDLLHRRPTDAELADYMGLPEKTLSRQTAGGRSGQTLSLDSGSAEPGGRALRWADTLADPRAEDPAAGAHRATLKTLILKGLSAQERRILLLYYYEECTMKEVGAALGLSESRVSQIHQALLDRLRDSFAHRPEERIA